MIAVDGVYDIECAEWDRFRCGELLGADGSRYVSWDGDDFYAALRQREGTWWAHSGGRYDALWVLDQAFRKGDVEPKMVPRGAGLMTLRLNKLVLCDSAALWPDKLDTVAQIAGKRKMAFPLRCTCESAGCEGYCALSRRLDARERAQVGEYLHADCVGLLASLRELCDRATADGIVLKPTVGSTAWTTARTWLQLESAPDDLGTYRQIREGAKGGRVEVVRTEAERGHRRDRHASYPAALSHTSLPEGEPVVHDLRGAKRAWSKGRPGIYQARIIVPESHVPPLASREEERLLYPFGPIEGAWALPEIAYAESLGCRIESITGAVTWASESAWLKPYADRVWALREEAMRGGACDKAYAKWLKWLANSLTGKLAQKPESDVYEYEQTPYGHVPEAEDAEAVIRVTPHGKVYCWEQTRIGACAHVQAYAYLTAEARCELHRQMLAAGDGLCYSDTDSVYSTTRVREREGDALGEWGYEGPMTDWSALSPKLYRYRCGGKPHCEKHARPDWHVRGKGMPGLTASGFTALTDGESWTIARGVLGFRDAMRRDGPMFKRRELKRSIKVIPGWVGGRELVGGGRTRATTVARYRAKVVGNGWFG